MSNSARRRCVIFDFIRRLYWRTTVDDIKFIIQLNMIIKYINTPSPESTTKRLEYVHTIYSLFYLLLFLLLTLLLFLCARCFHFISFALIYIKFIDDKYCCALKFIYLFLLTLTHTHTHTFILTANFSLFVTIRCSFFYLSV